MFEKTKRDDPLAWLNTRTPPSDSREWATRLPFLLLLFPLFFELAEVIMIGNLETE
jgi:hypothetical protein